MVPPSLSIVAAAYNSEKEIAVLFDSLIHSTERDFEVCLCDDGSTDGTLQKIESYRGRLDLRVIRNKTNLGVAAARNQALALARAPLLLFLDADVRLYPDTISCLRRGLNETGADVFEGIYSPVALDGGLISAYYAAFAHHSFLISDHPVAYNVFNAWCALCRREAMDAVGGHAVTPKGVEVENEALGRKLVARGFKIMIDPSIAVDHHWGGTSKVFFIFTRRVYWWVKTFFADGRRFELCLTTPSYGLGTAAFPAAAVLLAASVFNHWLIAPAVFLAAAFAFAYVPFYRFALRYKGPLFGLACLILSAAFSFVITASAAYSSAEELLSLAVKGRPSLDPAIFGSPS